MRKEEYFIASSYCDPNLKLKYPTFLRIFQDVADRNSEDIGSGKEVTMNKGMLWVLLRTYVEFDEMPNFLDKVTFYSYPSGFKGKTFFNRQGGMIKDGKPVIRLSSTWCLIDKDTRKLIFNPNLPLVSEESELTIKDPDKIEKEPTSYIESRIARYSDGDLNGHLNNVKYVDWILDTHEPEFYKKNVLKTLLINYESEVRLGEKLDIYANNELTYFEGRVGDKLSFNAKLTFAPRK